MVTYLIKDFLYYKIGRTVSLENRLDGIYSHNISAQIISFIDGDIEKKLHRKFKNKRIKNEWFQLNDSDVGYILNEFGNPQSEDIKYKQYIIESGLYAGRHLISMKTKEEIEWLRLANGGNRFFEHWAKYYLRYINIIEMPVIENSPISKIMNFDNLNDYEEIILLKQLLNKHTILSIQGYADKYKITYNGTKVRIKSGKLNNVIINGATFIID